MNVCASLCSPYFLLSTVWPGANLNMNRVLNDGANPTRSKVFFYTRERWPPADLADKRETNMGGVRFA